MDTESDDLSIQVNQASFNSFYRKGNKITLNFSIDDHLIIQTIDISLVNNIRTCNIDHHIFIYGLQVFPYIFFIYNPKNIVIKAKKMTDIDLKFWNKYYNNLLEYFWQKNEIKRTISIINPIENSKQKMNTIISLPRPKDKMDLVLRLSCLKGAEYNNPELERYNAKVWEALERKTITWDTNGINMVFNNIQNILRKRQTELNKCTKNKSNIFNLSSSRLENRAILYSENNLETAVNCEILKKSKIGVDLLNIISGDAFVYKHIYKTKGLVDKLVSDTLDVNLNELNIVKDNFVIFLKKLQGDDFDKILYELVFDAIVNESNFTKIDNEYYGNKEIINIKILLNSYKFYKTTDMNDHHLVFTKFVGLENVYNKNYKKYENNINDLYLINTSLIALVAGLKDYSLLITPYTRYKCIFPDPTYIKSYNFERDFNSYLNKRLNTNFKYFSSIRPLYSTQLCKIMSKFLQYNYLFFENCEQDSCAYNFLRIFPFFKTKDLLYYSKTNILDDTKMLDTYLKLTGVTDNSNIYKNNNFDRKKENMFLILLSSEKNENLPYIINHFIKNVKELCKVKKFRKNFFQNFAKKHNIPDNLIRKIRTASEILLKDEQQENFSNKNNGTITFNTSNLKDVLVIVLLVLLALKINSLMRN